MRLKVHPHMLRHACGYALANQGHDTRALQAYLGHKNIQQVQMLLRTVENAAAPKRRRGAIVGDAEYLEIV